MTSISGQAEDMLGPLDGWTAGPEGHAGRRCKGLRGNRVSRISELINYEKTRMSLQVPGLYRCGCNGEFDLNKYAGKLFKLTSAIHKASSRVYRVQLVVQARVLHFIFH